MQVEGSEQWGNITTGIELIKKKLGKEDADNSVAISESLFTGNIKSLSESEIETAFHGVPTVEITEEIKLIDLLVNNNIASSRR